MDTNTAGPSVGAEHDLYNRGDGAEARLPECVGGVGVGGEMIYIGIDPSLTGTGIVVLDESGIVIDIHRGLRTSGASSAINEFNWSLEEAQIHGQWSKVDTLKEFYGKYDLERIRGLQKRMVIPMKKREKK